jgi:hypothetical protein
MKKQKINSKDLEQKKETWKGLNFFLVGTSDSRFLVEKVPSRKMRKWLSAE